VLSVRHGYRRAHPGAAVEPDATFARSDSMRQEYEKHQAEDDANHRVYCGRHDPLTP
jgi:hypothetical protein